jgi:hypothetical protein
VAFGRLVSLVGHLILVGHPDSMMTHGRTDNGFLWVRWSIQSFTYIFVKASVESSLNGLAAAGKLASARRLASG